MIPPARPPDEAARQQALVDCAVLDSPPEGAFNDLVELAARITGRPMALVSLVDADRQWFKASLGVEATETPREISFCGHAIALRETLEVQDTLLDPRFADNPLVTGEMGLRYYLGAPIFLPEGAAVGTLCVLDRQPHCASEADRRTLEALARQVADQLVLRRELRRSQDQGNRLRGELAELRSHGLTGAQMDAAFPFHFAVDGALRVVRAGPRLRAHLPGVLGRALAELFVIEAPRVPLLPQELRRCTRSLVLLRARHSRMLLRGQLIPADGEVLLIFVGSPWVTEVAELQGLGLTLRDFALHDPVADFLFLIQSKDSALGELDRVAQQLSRERGELRQLNTVLGLLRAASQLILQHVPLGQDIGPALQELVARWLGWSAQGLWSAGEEGLPEPVAAALERSEEQVGAQPGGLLVAMPVDLKDQPRALSWLAPAHPRPSAEVLQALGSIRVDLEGALERQRAARRLEQMEQRRAAVLQGALDAVVTIDPRGEIVEFNPSAERTFGLRADEVLGRRMADLLIPEAHHQAHAHGLEEHLRTGRTRVIGRRIEVPARHPEKGEIPVEMAIVRTTGERGPMFTAFMRDISDRHAAARAMKEAAEAAMAASQAKSDFLATVSHEIRTPMNAILGMTDIALQSRSISEMHSCLARVQRNADALLVLINDILDVSKIEAGQLELEERPFDLQELIEDVIEGFVIAAMDRSLELRCCVAPEVPEWWLGDPARIRQVLVNLLGNAIKFTEKGYVALTVAVEAWREQPPQLLIEVMDSGIGMDATAQEHVFEMFWRAASARGRGGTGLGLPITRSLVERMGGSVHLQSEVGRGSIFRVHLPLRPAVAPTFGQASAELPAVWLLVRDSSRRWALARALQGRGFPVYAGQVPEQGPPTLEGKGLIVVYEGLDSALAEEAGRARRWGATMLCLAQLGVEDLRRAADDIILHEPVGPRRLLRQLMEVAQVQGGAEAPAPALPEGLNRPRLILLVEDNIDNQRLAVHMLQRAGYRVEVAPNGEEALRRTERMDFDLILMDIEMPVRDGLETTQLMREREQLSHRRRVPIIALTAHAMEGFRQRCVEVGMDDYATKPIRRARLLEVVSTWVDRSPRVLVVDDAADSREVLRRFLGADGRMRVTTCERGEEAVELVAQGVVDLVLVDMEMPGIGGLEVARRIRELKLEHRVPVVAVSGHSAAMARPLSLEAGCVAYIEKPVKRRRLLQVVAPLVGLAEVGP